MLHAFPDASRHVRAIQKNHPKTRRTTSGFSAERSSATLNEDPSLRKVPAKQLIRNVIYEDGGPLIHNGWEDEQRSFDSTCRKFHHFLTQSRR
jgi:hypothetical protein